MTNADAHTAATVVERGAHVAPERASSKKGASRKKSAPKGQKTAKGGKGRAATPRKAAKTPREGSKKAEVLTLLGRKDGATLAQLMKVTGWRAHSVRGFLSGALGKKMGLKIESQKRENGDRVYLLTK